LPTELLNMIPEEFRPAAIVVFFLAGAIFFWLKWTDTIPQGSLGIRTSAGAIKLRYNKKKYSKAEIARQIAVDEPLVAKGQPAKYGRPKIWQPGLHLQVMVYHKFDKIVAQDQPFDVDDIMVPDEAGYRGIRFTQVKVYVCAADVYLVRAASSDAPATLKAVVNTSLSRIMREAGYDAAAATNLEYQAEIATKLEKAARRRLKQVGLKFVGLDLGTAVDVVELATGRAVATTGDGITMAKLAASLGDPVKELPGE